MSPPIDFSCEPLGQDTSVLSLKYYEYVEPGAVILYWEVEHADGTAENGVGSQ